MSAEAGLPQTLGALLDAGGRLADGAPPALLVTTPPAPRREGSTQRLFQFRTSHAGETSVEPPADPHAVFSRASPLCWVRKRELGAFANPFASMITVGRAVNNDVCLGGATLSSVHVIFTRAPDGSFTVADQGTTNGSWLNGKALAAREPAAIRPGDALVLAGSVVALFLDAPALERFAREHAARHPHAP